VLAGAPATFSLEVKGDPTPQCLWLRNGAVIEGATSCGGYSTPATSGADNGAFYNVVVYNAGGVAIGNGALLTVQSLVAPAFTLQPLDASTTVDGQAQFTARASGTPLPSYEWLIDGAVLPSKAASHAQGSCSFLYDAFGVNLAMVNVSAGCDGRLFALRATNDAGSATSNAAVLKVNPALPANALTATQIVAGYEWSMALRPDRTVWAWGGLHHANGTVGNSIPLGQEATRPVRMYPAVLTEVSAIAGWYDAFWALRGTPGTTGSRVLHWGTARDGVDGRGSDGKGGIGASPPQYRTNFAAPVEVLERVNDVAQPVDRVCSIAGGASQLLMVRAIDSAGTTTDCNAGSAKTVWYVGSLTPIPGQSSGVAFALPGLPADSPPAAIFLGQTFSGTPPLAIALEDGRAYGFGTNPYGGFGVPTVGGGHLGGLGGPEQLPGSWGKASRFGMSFYYSLFVLRGDGSVLTSGYDGSGELGLGSVLGGSVLGPLPVLAETCVASNCADALTGIAALASNSSLSTLALKNGAILGWGSRGSGLLGPEGGLPQPFPRLVPSGVTGFTALSSANAHALAIGPGNVVYAWGSGLRAALGDGVNGGTRTAPGLVSVP
jgi:alpha-tubulin suppressor-like RCC1 family protein